VRKLAYHCLYLQEHKGQHRVPGGGYTIIDQAFEWHTFPRSEWMPPKFEGYTVPAQLAPAFSVVEMYYPGVIFQTKVFPCSSQCYFISVQVELLISKRSVIPGFLKKDTGDDFQSGIDCQGVVKQINGERTASSPYSDILTQLLFKNCNRLEWRVCWYPHQRHWGTLNRRGTGCMAPNSKLGNDRRLRDSSSSKMN